MEINWIEWLGYLASLLVLVSLLMGSIIKLRWINLAGSGLFSLYGFLLGALPVALMNLGTVLINIYYLVKIYRGKAKKELFKALSFDRDSEYFNYFLHFYNDEIKKYIEPSLLKGNSHEVSLYILRNMALAGIFLGSKHDDDTLIVELDFAVPEYRDFKIGHFIYEDHQQYFLDKGYKRFISFTSNQEHNDYFKKMGFVEKEENGRMILEKAISPSREENEKGEI